MASGIEMTADEMTTDVGIMTIEVEMTVGETVVVTFDLLVGTMTTEGRSGIAW